METADNAHCPQDAELAQTSQHEQAHGRWVALGTTTARTRPRGRLTCSVVSWRRNLSSVTVPAAMARNSGRVWGVHTGGKWHLQPLKTLQSSKYPKPNARLPQQLVVSLPERLLRIEPQLAMAVSVSRHQVQANAARDQLRARQSKFLSTAAAF